MRAFVVGVALIASLTLAQSALALGISPVRQTITLDPGDSEVLRIEVTNESNVAKEVIGEVDAFITDDETGAALFGQDDKAKDWIQVPQQSYSILPGATQVLTFPIRVPDNASAGSHYLGLFAKELPASGDVKLSTRVGSLLFAYVGGTLDESLVRESFEFEGTLTQVDRTISLTLKNTGDIHVAPTGVVVIEGWNGKELGRYFINTDGRNVTPDAKFVETFEIKDKGVIGPVNARATVRYGVNEQEFTVLARTWIMPVWVIVSISIFILIIIGLYIARQYAKK